MHSKNAENFDHFNSLIPQVAIRRQLDDLAAGNYHRLSGRAARFGVIYISELPRLGRCFWKYLPATPHEGNACIVTATSLLIEEPSLQRKEGKA